MKKLLSDYKKTLTPPYSSRDALPILLLLAAVLLIPISILFLSQQAVHFTRASNAVTINPASATTDSNVTIKNDDPSLSNGYITFGSSGVQAITIDAANATLTAGAQQSFTLAADGSISQSGNSSGTPSNGGKAVFAFTIATAGDYTAKAVVDAPTVNNDSLYVRIDGEPTDPTMIWDITPLTSGFEERTVTWRGTGTVGAPEFNPKTFTLTTGAHTLVVRGREPGVKIKQFIITPVQQQQVQGSSERAFPTNSGMVNVKDNGVVGDGVTDDTAALQALIQSRSRPDQDNSVILYFPSGTYLISNTLEWRDSSGNYKAYLSFQGSGEDQTIIKLKDNASGYGSASSPKAVIYTASTLGSTSDPAYYPPGDGNEAYRNNIYDMTINTGTGNPGAIGISYLANNRGTVGNVKILSGDGLGVTGLAMTRRNPGPCLIKNVTVDGFNTGIDVKEYDSTATLEYITLKNQKVVGISNTNNGLFIRKLTSSNSVPAIKNVGTVGLLTVIDSILTGTTGASGFSAIEFGGGIFARNITTSGYASALKFGANVIAGQNVTEYVPQVNPSFPAVLELFPSTKKSLALPIKETPEAIQDPLSAWVNVQDFGATPKNVNSGDDDGVGIQAAIDSTITSGKTTLYFPKSIYKIKNPIIIRGNVRTIMGFDSSIYLTFANAFSDAANPNPLIQFDNGTPPVVIIDSMRIAPEYGTIAAGSGGLKFNTTRTLVLKHTVIGGQSRSYSNIAGAGDLFLEDVQMNKFFIDNPQDVWARQWNPEGGETRLVNNGGKIWALGVKTENRGTIIDNRNNGSVEIIGGAHYPAQSTIQPTDVVYINNNANFSSSFLVGSQTSEDKCYQILVRDTRDAVIKELTRTTAPKRGSAYCNIVPLFVGTQ